MTGQRSWDQQLAPGIFGGRITMADGLLFGVAMFATGWLLLRLCQRLAFADPDVLPGRRPERPIEPDPAVLLYDDLDELPPRRRRRGDRYRPECPCGDCRSA